MHKMRKINLANVQMYILLTFALSITNTTCINYFNSPSTHDAMLSSQHKQEDNSPYMHGATQMLQFALYYGIEENKIKNSKEMTQLERILFLISNSLFLQLLLIFILMVIAFLILNYKTKQGYNDKLNQLITEKQEEIQIKNSEYVDKEKNNKGSDVVIKLEGNKFGEFLHKLRHIETK